MSLLTRNLIGDLFSLHRGLDSLFDKNWNSFGNLPVSASSWMSFFPEVETYAKGSDLVYRLALPGVDPKDVDLSILGGKLIVKGERKTPKEIHDEDWGVRSFQYGRFERSFRLPEGIDLEKVRAQFNNGLLEITVPASKAALPRKIEIQQLESGEEADKLKESA